MDLFEIADVLARRRASSGGYVEFLRVPALSVGAYHLPVNGVDPQSPHAEDEIYYVIRGRATIRVGDEGRPVREGTVVYVRANEPHAFHSITKDLEILVVFAPAEGTRSRPRARRRRATGPGRRSPRRRGGSRPRPRAERD